MKRISLIVALVVAASLAFMGCPLPSNNNNNNNTPSVATVASVTVNAADLPASGAEGSIESVQDIMMAAMGMAQDPLLASLMSPVDVKVEPQESFASFVARTAAQAQDDLMTLLMQDMADIQAQFEAIDSGESLSVNKSISYTDKVIQDIVTLNTLSASIDLDITTTEGDSLVIDEETGLPNVDTITLDGRLSVDVEADETALAAGKSFIKGAAFKANVAVMGDTTGVDSITLFEGTEDEDVISFPEKVTASYAASMALGVSLCVPVMTDETTLETVQMGGKLVLAVSSSLEVTDLDVATVMEANMDAIEEGEITTDMMAIVESVGEPVLSITLSAYDDDNADTFTRTWNSLEDLMSDEELAVLFTPQTELPQ